MSKDGQQPFQQFIGNIKQKSCSEVGIGIKDMYCCSDRYFESKPHQEFPQKTKGNKGISFCIHSLGAKVFCPGSPKTA